MRLQSNRLCRWPRLISEKSAKCFFQVSAFGNPQAKETGQEMILRMLENKLSFEKRDGKEEACA